MKTPLTRTMLFAALGLAIAFTACKKDDDEPSSPSGGQTTPPTDPRTAYTGTWLVTDSLWLDGMPYDPPFETYVLSITTGGTVSDTLWFNNLWNDGTGYYAILANNFFAFPSQNVSGPYNVSGNGTFSGTHLFYQTSGDVYVHHGYGEKQ
ncbi:MAG TPA: hypothetical protein PKD45_07970 [Flavobacteriales bacterium]|nr:hypothetical protein [Flavobacteriales bacterium]